MSCKYLQTSNVYKKVFQMFKNMNTDISRKQVQEIVDAATKRIRQAFSEQLDQLTLLLNQVVPLTVHTYALVSISSIVAYVNASLDLIKLMNYYEEDSEKYHIAMGIFQNNITKSS